MSALKVWDGTQWVWVSQPITSLDQLADVTVTSPATGKVIRWDGAVWRDAVLTASDVTNAVTTDTTQSITGAKTFTQQVELPSATIIPSIGTAKGRIGGLPGIEAWTGMFLNASFNGSAWVLDDVTKPGWFFKMDSRPVATEFAVYRIPAGANPHTDEAAMFKVSSTGVMTTANYMVIPEVATPSTLPSSGTRQFYMKSDGKLYSRTSAGVEKAIGGDPVAPIATTEPAGAVDGLLWYDSDLDLDDPEVYVQDYEPLGTPEGTLWYDIDETADQPIDGSTGIVDGTVTEAKLSTGVQTKLNTTPEKVAVQIKAGDKGAWSAVSAYAKGDVVNYQGKSWVATAAIAAPNISGNDPTLSGKAVGATPSGSAIAVTIPATVQAGDEMLVVVSTYSAAWTTTNISGGSAGAWTVLAANQSASATYTTYSTLLRKVAAAGDAGATLTVSGLNGSYCAVDFRAYRYATYDKYVYLAQNSPALPLPSPALTTTAGRGITVHVVASMTNTSTSPTISVDTRLSNIQTAVSPSYFVNGSGDEVRTAASGGTPGRNFTPHATGGFATWAVSYIGTRTVDGNTFDTNVWQELPFSPNSGGQWELIQVLTPTGSAATAANCRFDNIPTKYRKLRIECDGINTAAVTSGNIYMVFNSTTSLAYYQTMEYRSTGAWSQTSSATASYAHVAYNYFYSGPGRRSKLRVDVFNDTLTQPLYETDFWCQVGAGNYVYRSKCDGAWNATAKITRIELYTSNGGNWNCDQPIFLYGWVD